MGGRRARTELCRLTGRQDQGRPAGKKGGCGWATFGGWGEGVGGGAGRAHWGAAQTTGKGTPPKSGQLKAPALVPCHMPGQLLMNRLLGGAAGGTCLFPAHTQAK